MSRIQRRIHQVGVYFVTTHTWQRRELFRQEGSSRIVVGQLFDCRDRGFYKLHAFVIMPDHLHVLLKPGEGTPIGKAIQMIKGGSAFRIKKELGFHWPVWQPGFHDRWIRDKQEYLNCKHYILQNPVKAKLVERAEEYAWTSANGKYELDHAIFEELPGLKPQS